MREMTINDLKFEGLHLEYKKAVGGLPKSFWETYSAFANTDGGEIFLGIEEIGKHQFAPAQLNKENIEDLKTDLFSTLNNPIKVSINLLSDEDVEEVGIDGSLVLIVKVPKCPTELKPVYINSNIYQGTFRRNNDGDFRCNVEEVNSMLRDSTKKPLDLGVIEDQELSSLNQDSIKAYMNMFAKFHPDHPFLKATNDKFLEFIGAARLGKDDKLHPTKAGLLMFGYSYRIVYDFPEYFLDYIEPNDTRWNDRIYSDSGTWSGNIFDFFTLVTTRINKDLKVPFQMKGIYRDDDNPLHKSVREALCNAICNTDFNLGTGVVVKKYEDRLVFTNPGCLMMNVEQMIKGGTSLPRNKTLLKLLNFINVGERAGSGIPFIFTTAKEFNFKKPTIVEQFRPDRTIVTMYISSKKNSTSLEKKDNDILDYLKENGPSSAKQISENLGKNVTTIKLSLYSLKEKQYVSTTGTIKDKKYFLV